jgi:transcriptional regulator with XRE-family HTH domain
MLTAAQFRDYLQARRNAGHSLTAIGASLGVSHAAVGHWLAGKREPSSTVLILAELLGRSWVWPHW